MWIRVITVSQHAAVPLVAGIAARPACAGTSSLRARASIEPVPAHVANDVRDAVHDGVRSGRRTRHAPKSTHCKLHEGVRGRAAPWAAAGLRTHDGAARVEAHRVQWHHAHGLPLRSASRALGSTPGARSEYAAHSTHARGISAGCVRVLKGQGCFSSCQPWCVCARVAAKSAGFIRAPGVQNSAAGLSDAARERQNARARIGRAGAYPTRPAAKHGIGTYYHAGVVDHFVTAAGGARLVEDLAQSTSACLAAARRWHASTPLLAEALDDNMLLSRLWRAGSAAMRAPPWYTWGITQAPRNTGPCVAELHAMCAAQGRLHLAAAIWCQGLKPLLRSGGLEWGHLLARAQCTDAELQARSAEVTRAFAEAQSSDAVRGGPQDTAVAAGSGGPVTASGRAASALGAAAPHATASAQLVDGTAAPGANALAEDATGGALPVEGTAASCATAPAWARVAATPRVAALRCTFDFNRAVSDRVMRLRHLGGRLLGHASMGGQKSAPRMGTAYPVPI